jgi:hypothetical protein
MTCAITCIPYISKIIELNVGEIPKKINKLP